MTPLLVETLAVAVPRVLRQIQAQGGPTAWDMSQAREIGALLGAHGDVLLFGSPTQGEAAQLFTRLAHAVAVLAWMPGGVTILGHHWESPQEEPP